MALLETGLGSLAAELYSHSSAMLNTRNKYPEQSTSPS